MSARALALAVAAGTLLAAAAPAAPTMLVLGDSYASGEGLASAQGACGTESERSWGAIVGAASGADTQLLACSGAQVEDVTVGGPLGRDPQLTAATPADTVLLTVGGNDLGFVEIVADCLGLAELEEGPAVSEGSTWTQLVDTGRIDGGCDVTTDDLLSRVADLGAPDRFQLDDAGGRGSMVEVYVTVHERAVVEGGRLVVVGYPSLLADPAAWPRRYGRRCHGVRAEDAADLLEVVQALDEALAEAARAADEVLGGRGAVTYVSTRAAYAGDGGEDHRLCGGGEPWLNGLTVVEGGVDVAELLVQLGTGDALDLERIGARPGGSFHPATAGHRGTAELVLDALGQE